MCWRAQRRYCAHDLAPARRASYVFSVADAENIPGSGTTVTYAASRCRHVVGDRWFARVSLGRVASVVASSEGLDGLGRLLTLVTLSFVVGNLDMHARNFSLLQPPQGPAKLAPAYDVVPLTHYSGIDGRMAMAINDIYEHSRISRSDFNAEVGRWGLAPIRAEQIIDQSLAVIWSTVQDEAPHARAVPGLPALIDSLAVRFGPSEEDASL